MSKTNRNMWLSFTFDKDHMNTMNNINNNLYNYDIDVIDINMLHMTCVFIGKALQGKDKQTITLVNNTIKRYTSTLKDMKKKIKFDRFDYLPFNSSKKKLLVAIYKHDKDINDQNVMLRKELMKLCVCAYDDDILLHITMGRIKSLDNLPDLKKIEKYPDIDIRGIHTCGTPHKFIDKMF